jgi:hypothetical protein
VENQSLNIEQGESVTDPFPAPQSGSNLPVLITLVALIVWFGFQTLQLFRERTNLGFVKENQETAIKESEKIRVQFQAIMTKTSDLANQGHAGAKLVMDELQRRGMAVAPEVRPADKIETKAAK